MTLDAVDCGDVAAPSIERDNPVTVQLHTNLNRLPEFRDHYLNNPPVKPKLTIHEDLKREFGNSEDFYFGEAFRSLKDALYSLRVKKNDMFLRSEHFTEYNGESGINVTYLAKAEDQIGIPENKIIVRDERNNQLTIEFKDESDLQFKLNDLYYSEIYRYCIIKGIDPISYFENIRYSYWERVPGCNCAIISDSSVEGRYHIMIENDYFIVENNNVIFEGSNSNNISLQNLNKILSSYKKLVNYNKFDPDHCYIVEFQWNNNKMAPLQFHRTRDFEPAKFKLTRPLEEGETVVDFVRGVTPEEGIIVDAGAFMDIPNYNELTSTDYDIGELHNIMYDDEASFDLKTSPLYVEIIAKRRKVCFREASLSFLSNFKDHISRTVMFKPELYVLLGQSIPKELGDYALSEYYKGNIGKIRIRVISDGRKCYIKYL